MKYRVFTNDIGPGRYSCFCLIDADSDEQAQRIAESRCKGLQNFNGRAVKVLVIPDDRKDLMPDGKTGRLPK